MVMQIDTPTKRTNSHFINYIYRRCHRDNRNFVGAVTGETGSGKSYSCLRLGEMLDPDFDERNVCFTPEEFMNLINGKEKKLKRGSVIVFDELQVSLSHMDYQTLQAKLLNYVLQTFRHRNFICFMTTPHFEMVNRTARRLFHGRIETVSVNHVKKVCSLKPFLLQINQRTGKVYEKYLRVAKDGMVAPVRRLNLRLASKPLIKRYEEKKDRFTRELNIKIQEGLSKGKTTTRRERFGQVCNKCKHEWTSPKPNPIKCPLCQSRNISNKKQLNTGDR